jgi:hypothetical protein
MQLALVFCKFINSTLSLLKSCTEVTIPEKYVQYVQLQTIQTALLVPFKS